MKWGNEDDCYLRAHWHVFSAALIAQALNRTRSAVIGRVYRLGKAWRLGLSPPAQPRPARKAAKRKPKTAKPPSGPFGKPSGPQDQNGRQPRREAQQLRAAAEPGQVDLETQIGRAGLTNPEVFPKDPPIEASASAQPTRASVFELGPFDCRWPMGEVGAPDFGFCGRPADGPYGYCPHHRVISKTGRS